MANKIAIDPITRIEGHLRIEAQIENGHVTDAWSSSTMFRGLEIIAKGRDPRGMWLMAQRICGVCTTVHAFASVRAVEDALDIRIPENARIIRNLIEGFQYVQDHVIHFYHLHGLDWVDIVSALSADPAKTATLAQSLSSWPLSGEQYFTEVKAKLNAFVNTGQLGIFANGYWGHSAYKLPPEANLMAVAHYLEALDWQRDMIKAHAILGAKNPHPQTYLVGGMAIPIDPNSAVALNADKLAELHKLAAKSKAFVEQVYVPDLLAVASFYPEWLTYGEGLGNFLAYGEFPDAAGELLMPRGIIVGRDLSTVLPLDQEKITEYVAHSWYNYDGGDDGSLHPYNGETNPNYTGPQPPYDFLETESKYSWLKAPRYDNQAMEVGPLARMLVAYASGQLRVQQIVNDVLKKLGAGPEALFSTLGRTAARGIETLLVTEQLDPWLTELEGHISDGDYRIHNGERWDPATWPKEASGWGFQGAPRGALGHWIQIRDQKVANYQCVVPTTWNASPRDASGQPGAYEAALVGVPVADPQQPLEILRVIHSFDPCMACAVHVVDAQHRELIRVEVDGRMQMIEQTLVLGLGNILCGDDGVGVRVVERLQTAGRFPAEIRILDGGTLGLDLLPYVREADRLLIIDSMEMCAAPGTVIRLCDREVGGCLAPKLSPHQMGLRDLLGAARLCGYQLQELILWGVQPGDLKTGLELSPPVAASVEPIVSAVLSELNLQESRPATSAGGERIQPYHPARGDSSVAPP